MASGDGCPGPDNGAGIEVADSQGTAFWGDSDGAALPDGTWELSATFPVNSPPGRYTVRAKCVGNAGTLFEDAPQLFTVTG